MTMELLVNEAIISNGTASTQWLIILLINDAAIQEAWEKDWMILM